MSKPPSLSESSLPGASRTAVFVIWILGVDAGQHFRARLSRTSDVTSVASTVDMITEPDEVRRAVADWLETVLA